MKITRGTLFNFLFSGVVLFVQPTFLTAIEQVVYHHRPNWLVGAVCFTAIVADTYAILKFPRYAVDSVIGVFLWMAHMALTSVTLMIALSAFAPGITEYSETSQPGTVSILVFLFFMTVNTIKEIVVLMRIIDDAPNTELPKPIWQGEVALLCAASIQSVTFLGLLVSGTGANTGFSHGPMIVVELIASFILFGFGFFPLRLPYTLKEIAAFKQSRNGGYIASVLLAWLVTIYPLIR